MKLVIQILIIDVETLELQYCMRRVTTALYYSPFSKGTALDMDVATKRRGRFETTDVLE